jgi:hypothetical protein
MCEALRSNRRLHTWQAGYGDCISLRDLQFTIRLVGGELAPKPLFKPAACRRFVKPRFARLLHGFAAITGGGKIDFPHLYAAGTAKVIMD